MFELKNFHHDDFGDLSVGISHKVFGELFNAKNVCKMLDIKNVSDTMARLEKDEKFLLNKEGNEVGIDSTDTNKFTGSKWYVNEPGLCRLIFSSNKNEAKEIQRWIFHVVLPAIRKTGQYSVENPTTKQIAQKMSKAQELKMAIDYWDQLHRYIKKTGKKGVEAINYANRGVLEEYGIDLAKKAGLRFIENGSGRTLLYTPTQLGEELKWGEGKGVGAKINRALEQLGLQEKSAYIGSNGEKKWEWEATEKGKEFCDFEHFTPEHGKKALKRILWKKEVLDLLRGLELVSSEK